MEDSLKLDIIEKSWKLHSIIESSFLENQAIKGDTNWGEKQRLLLADMAIHLLQTSLKPGDLDLEKLRNNLNAILTISDQYLPNAGLGNAADHLFEKDFGKLAS